MKEWGDAQSLAALLVPDGEKKECVLEHVERRLLTAFIYYCAKYEAEGYRNLQRALDLMVNPRRQRPIRASTTKTDHRCSGSSMFMRLFVATEDPNLIAAADSLISFMNNENHLSSSFRSRRTSWNPGPALGSPPSTQRTSHNWDSDLMWRAALLADLGASEGEIVGDGQYKVSIFLIVPPEYIKPFASVLRIIIGFHIREMLKAARYTQSKAPNLAMFPRIRSFFCSMSCRSLAISIRSRTAITIVRSARLRFWLFAQDISQLKKIYPGWETIIANCRAKMFFGINDLGTAEHVSALLGKNRDLCQGKGAPLASPGELLHQGLPDRRSCSSREFHRSRRSSLGSETSPGMVTRAEKAMVEDVRPDFDEPVVQTLDTSSSDLAASNPLPLMRRRDRVECYAIWDGRKKRGSQTRRRSVSDTTKKSAAPEPPETDEPTFVDLVEQNWASRPRKPDPN